MEHYKKIELHSHQETAKFNLFDFIIVFMKFRLHTVIMCRDLYTVVNMQIIIGIKVSNIIANILHTCLPLKLN